MAAKLPDQDDAHRGGPENVMVVIDHHEAKLYVFDIRSPNQSEHTIRPHDSHHVTRKDRSGDGDAKAEDPAFYEAVCKALVSAARIVVVGHGTGKSNAALHLVEYVTKHHPDTARHVVQEVVADISSLTERQLLDVGRRAVR